MKEFYFLISTTEVNNSNVSEEGVSQTSRGARTSTVAEAEKHLQ